MAADSTTARPWSLDPTGISRRGAIGGVAAATGAACLPAQAFAAVAGGGAVRSFEARYALPGGAIVAGFFAKPAARTKLDIVLLVHGRDGYGDRIRRTAKRYAAQGYLAVALDMPRSFGARDHDALLAAAKNTIPAFEKHASGNGRVAVVLA